MDPSPLIRIRDMKHTYVMGDSTVRALDGVSLDVKRGEYIAIMGPSGSGKSTLMNIIGCLESPRDGTYVLNGRDVSRLEDDDLADVRNREIGFVFQTFNLIAQSDCLGNVELPLIYAGVNAVRRRELARETLIKVGLKDRLHHRPNELSGGQRQRVAIARALVNNPSILLADEPTGNLDSRTSKEVMELFDGLHASGHTILMVTHEEDIAAFAQRIIRLRDGLIESDK